jgi:hypothetical protein
VQYQDEERQDANIVAIFLSYFGQPSVSNIKISNDIFVSHKEVSNFPYLLRTFTAPPPCA